MMTKTVTMNLAKLLIGMEVIDVFYSSKITHLFEEVSRLQ